MRQIQRSPVVLLLSFVLILLLPGCGSADNTRVLDNGLPDEISTPGVTTIMIDGEGDDWVNHPLLSEDEIGDAEGDFLDIGKIYAFLNQESLYVLIELANPEADFEQFDFEISADGIHHLFTWHKSFDNFGKFGHSEFMAGSVVEGKIDLDDIGSPESTVAILQIRVMSGDSPPSETWRAVDEVNLKPQYLAWIDEVDPGREEVAAEQQPEEPVSPEALTERPGHVWTTSGLKADYVHRSFLQIPVGMVWGPDGYLYIGDWAGHHVVKVSPDGSLEDLGLWKTVGPLQFDGPRGVAFDSAGNLYTNNHSQIFRIDPSGKVDQLDGVQAGPVGSIAISDADTLYYTDRSGGKLLRWNPDGTSSVILDGIPFAENMVFGHDGTLYLTQMGMADVLKVNVETGDYEVFARDVCYFDPCFLAVDLEGDIWIRAIWYIHQFTPEGEEKQFTVDGELYPDGPGTYNWHTSAGIAIDDQGGLYVASYNSKLMYLAPESLGTPDPTFTLKIVSTGFEAIDLAISSTGVVYGTDRNQGQVIAFPPDLPPQVIYDHGDTGAAAVAVDSQDRLFIGIPQGEILRVEEDDSVSHYADLLTSRMVFGSDGTLYAVVSDSDMGQSIIGITGVDEYFVLTAELDGQPISGIIQISPALEKGLYVISESDRILYLVDFEGKSHFIADLRSLGGGGPNVMAADPVSGDVFFIPHGPYELYRITADGKTSKEARGVYGDPWGMVVSLDGKYVYVAESGAIDKIPIDDSQP